MIAYKVVNDTTYHADTPEEIVNILENARLNNIRLRLHYGDTDTGRDWDELYDTTGYVGRSTGGVKVPLLIFNKRSVGGAEILDNCIVKIETSKGKRTLYHHPNYHQERIETDDNK